MAKTIINLQVDEELKRRAQEKAQSEGESLSTIIRQFLRKWSEQK